MTAEEVLVNNAKVKIEIVQRECEATKDGSYFSDLPDAGWGNGCGKHITLRMYETAGFDVQGWILRQLKWICKNPADAIAPCEYGDRTIAGFTMDIVGDEYGDEDSSGEYDVRYMFDIMVGGHTMTGRDLETIFPILKS